MKLDKVMEEESWHKLDPLAASKQVEMDFLRDFGDTLMDFEASKSTVPDISDTVFRLSCLSENIETRFDCDDLLSVLSPRDVPDVDLGLGLDSVSEPLRQDCMWSGVRSASEERRHQPEAELSVFHTPTQSDFETSDLDESFSDLESSNSSPAPVVTQTQRAPDNVPDNVPDVIADKHSVLLDHMYTDHFYISSSAPSMSGEKQAPPGHTIKSTKEKNRITVKRKPSDNKTNIVKVYQNKTKSGIKNSSSAKFKFQMKFLSPSSSSALTPLGLGRSASARRRTAIKNAFCPTPARSSEVRSAA